MGTRYWRDTVFTRAWRETREQVRWDSPVRIMIFISPIAVGLCVWLALGATATGFPIQAMGTALAVVLIAAVLVVWKVATIPAILAAEADERYTKETQSMEAERDQLRAERDAVRHELNELRRPPPPPARNPDGVYQDGRLVGMVAGAVQNIEARRATFQTIRSAGEFAPDVQFEYRDLVLMILNFQTQARAVIAGEVRNSLNGVTCEILRRR